ncbi:MAG TPA: NAD(P)/FAD-dependent oxidoreductase [Gemmataceae bacterium]|nr:NAD(P)/FAD-dependent oxidoreductase [Gemmataceae bacterium]
MHDAIVIGAGPNGLTAAVTLARHGWKVLVLEAKPRQGGAVYSGEFTLPGFLHDVGAAFFPFANDSPAFRYLDLVGAGLEWRNARRESCHPAPDGSCVSISRDTQQTAASFGADGDAWRRLAAWQARMGDRLAAALLAPLLDPRSIWHLGLSNVFKLGLVGLGSTAGFARRHFQTEAARRVFPSLALHVDLGPEDWSGAALALALAFGAAGPGFRIPVGGARAITEAMIRRLMEAGGEFRTNQRVETIEVRARRAVAVRTNGKYEIPFRRAVLADVGAPALYLRLLPRSSLPGWVRRSMRRFHYGWGTFKMDWALSAQVPWVCPEARESAVVHTGDSVADLIAFTRQVRAGLLPSNPYLVIGQQSLVDSSRAPAGCHTLWAYSRVPPTPEGGWARWREPLADRIEERIEQLAPGFRRRVRARAIHAPPDLEAMDENLVGGDLGGGSARLTQQLVFRPIFPYFRYRTPVRGVYMASASAHPGAGVHGACGFNAARAALRDAGMIGKRSLCD